MERRKTRQRQLILEAVRALEHPDAEEIFAAVTRKQPRLGRATVYRNLNLLVQQGEIGRIETGGADRFDGRTCPHYHLRCRSCGKIFDSRMPVLGGLERCLTETDGFLVESYTIEFIGLCPECNNSTTGGK